MKKLCAVCKKLEEIKHGYLCDDCKKIYNEERTRLSATDYALRIKAILPEYERRLRAFKQYIENGKQSEYDETIFLNLFRYIERSITSSSNANYKAVTCFNLTKEAKKIGISNVIKVIHDNYYEREGFPRLKHCLERCFNKSETLGDVCDKLNAGVGIRNWGEKTSQLFQLLLSDLGLLQNI